MKACNSKLYSFTKISGRLTKITTWKTRRKRPQQNGREGARANKPAAIALRGAVRGRTTWLRVRAGCVFIIRDSVAADTSTVALPATLNNFSNCAQRRNYLPHNRKFAAKYFCELYVTVNAIWSCFLGWFVKINDINFAKLLCT